MVDKFPIFIHFPINLVISTQFIHSVTVIFSGFINPFINVLIDLAIAVIIF